MFDNHIEDPIERSFFSEIIASIADARFAGKDGRYIYTRDYLTVKVRAFFSKMIRGRGDSGAGTDKRMGG